MVWAHELRRVAEVLAAETDAAMGAAVDEHIGVAILVAGDDDRHIADEVAFEIAAVGDFAA